MQLHMDSCRMPMAEIVMEPCSRKTHRLFVKTRAGERSLVDRLRSRARPWRSGYSGRRSLESLGFNKALVSLPIAGTRLTCQHRGLRSAGYVNAWVILETSLFLGEIALARLPLNRRSSRLVSRRAGEEISEEQPLSCGVRDTSVGSTNTGMCE